MKIRTVILTALATVTVSSFAFAASGDAGAGGEGGAGPVEAQYFKNVTSTAFPSILPCTDSANPFKAGCYTSFLVVADVDGDGDMDIVFANGGGYYEPDDYDYDNDKTVSGKESSVVYLNDGHGAYRDA